MAIKAQCAAYLATPVSPESNQGGTNTTLLAAEWCKAHTQAKPECEKNKRAKLHNASELCKIPAAN